MHFVQLSLYKMHNYTLNHSIFLYLTIFLCIFFHQAMQHDKQNFNPFLRYLWYYIIKSSHTRE